MSIVIVTKEKKTRLFHTIEDEVGKACQEVAVEMDLEGTIVFDDDMIAGKLSGWTFEFIYLDQQGPTEVYF